MKGTPKNLLEAIVNGAGSAELILPYNSTVGALEEHIRDFLAQKFTAAKLRAGSPDEEKNLDLLWDKIVR